MLEQMKGNYLFLEEIEGKELFRGVDEQALRKLQAKCAEEVKRINRAVKFEDAYEYQNRQ